MISFAEAFEQFASRMLPSGLTDAAHLRFQSCARLSSLAKDHTIEFDEAVPQLVMVARGATKLVAHASQSRDQIVAFHFAGDVLLGPAQDNYSYSVTALRDSELLAFPLPQFMAVAAEEAGVLGRLLEHTLVSLRRCREKAIALGRKTAGERMAVFLLGMAERIGVEQDGRITLDLPMSRRDISDSLGLTIETVSRELTKLRDDGDIATAGRSTIVLLRNPALHRRAGFQQEAA